MGKQGPCHHCGVTSTPLWRNGPPDKPVLCNACGSRWRTKGSLTNYFPLHSREQINLEETKVPKVRIISSKQNAQKVQKRKQENVLQEIEHEIPFCGQNFQKVLEEDTSNRSSSGSAISCSESCAHFGPVDANDIAASAQSNVWESLIPSRKRTCIPRPKPSAVEKLRKDLFSILHEQQSSISGTSDGDLLFDSETQTGSVEIGHGSVLIRPNPKVVEESEASSFPMDKMPCVVSKFSSKSASCLAPTGRKGTCTHAIPGKSKKHTAEVTQEHVKSDASLHDKLHVLQDGDSPLTSIDLKGVVTFETFMRLLSCEEQQQLMTFLPPVDISQAPASLRSMFCSTQFQESLHYFQELLSVGVLDLSMSGVDATEWKNLRKLVLCNFKKAKWVEQYQHTMDVKHKQDTSGNGINNFKNSCVTPPHGGQNQKYPGTKDVAKINKRKCTTSGMKITYKTQLNSCDATSRLTCTTDAFVEEEEVCFSPSSLFATSPERNSMMASFHFTHVSSNQDLLLDVPSNAAACAEAELLYYPCKQKNAVDRNPPADTGFADGEDSSSSFLYSSTGSHHPQSQ